MKVLLDSSALAKRFIPEKGSKKVIDACREADELCISIICYPEIISALNRLKNEKKINKHEYVNAKQKIATDLRDVSVCNITEDTVAQVVHLLEENSLRTMDAIHIAAALEWKTDLFISADQQQLKAAKKAGLKVQDVMK